MTVAPLAASRSAIARPMPRELPVTNAIFPSSETDIKSTWFEPSEFCLNKPRAKRTRLENERKDFTEKHF
jgi:hypothetical protein